jgi:hypothetical protein
VKRDSCIARNLKDEQDSVERNMMKFGASQEAEQEL